MSLYLTRRLFNKFFFFSDITWGGANMREGQLKINMIVYRNKDQPICYLCCCSIPTDFTKGCCQSGYPNRKVKREPVLVCLPLLPTSLPTGKSVPMYLTSCLICSFGRLLLYGQSLALKQGS